MRKVLLFVFVWMSMASNAFAQDDTYNKYDREGKLSSDSVNVKVMVIPTNPELYNSFYDRQMMEVNNLSFYKLRDTILQTLSIKVSEAINDTAVSAVVPESQSGYIEDMAFVYESIAYTYEPLPQPKEDVSTINKWKRKLSKKEPEPEKRKGTFMEEGQIVTNERTVPHFTNVKVINPDFLFILNKRYHAEIFVFINKYEMEIATSISQIDIQSENYPREIRVHFTVLDVEGNELTSGLIIRNSSSYDNQLNYLFNESFLYIGKEITDRIEFPVQEEALEKPDEE